MAKLLIDNKADVNAKDVSGSTPLHWTGQFGNFQFILLVGKQKKITSFVTSADTVDVAKLYIDNKGEVNAVDEDGDSPLHWCAYNGKYFSVFHHEIVENIFKIFYYN